MRKNFSELKDIAKCMHYYGETIGKPTPWHWLRLVKQGRGANTNQTLSQQQLSELPNLIETFSQRYNIQITHTNSFTRTNCDCQSRKQVVTCHGEVIPCSALKYGAKRGKYACLKRI